MPQTEQSIDVRQVRRNATRAAPGFDAADFFHAEIRERLLARLDLLGFAPADVLDLGTGTGAGAAALATRYPDARVAAVDFAPAMLAEAGRTHWAGTRVGGICADARALPLRDASLDLVFANLLLHWLDPAPLALAEVARVLKRRGAFLFSTLGPDSLRELRAAFAGIDAAQHALPLADMHNIGDALVAAGLSEPVMDSEVITVTYRDVRRLFDDIRGVGAQNTAAGRPRGLTGRTRWARMERALSERRGPDGAVPVTLEVVYGTAWAPGGGAGRRPRGPVEVPLADFRRKVTRRNPPDDA